MAQEIYIIIVMLLLKLNNLKNCLNVNLGALNDLGICYEYRKGVEHNFFKALEYYKKSSDKYYFLINYAILLIN